MSIFSLYSAKNSQLLRPPTSSESCKDWKADLLTVKDTRFLVFLFLFKSSNFIIANKYCQLFSFSNRLISFILKKLSVVNYPIYNNHSLSVVFSRKNVASFKKQLVQLTTKIMTRVFFLESTIVLWYATEVLYMYLAFCHAEH